MDLAAYRTRISFATGLSNQASSAEQAYIDSYVNEAAVQFVAETKCYWKKFKVSLQAGVAAYDLDAAILALKELWYESVTGQDVPMYPIDMAEITRRQTLAVTAGDYATVYALEGQNLLIIDPAAASSSDFIHGLYVPRPTPMTTGSHTPSTASFGNIPEEFHPALQSYAMSKITADDDKAVGKSPQEHAQEWEAAIVKARIKLNKKAGVLLAPARPGRKRIIPRTPGTDIRW